MSVVPNRRPRGCQAVLVVLASATLASSGCGRIFFDPLGGAGDDTTGLSDALVVPLADVVPLAACAPVDYEFGGVNPRDVPPLAWRDDLLLAGYHSNAFGVRRLVNGNFDGDNGLSPQSTDPQSADFIVTPSGFLAAWIDGGLNVRAMDLDGAPTAPTANYGDGGFSRLQQNNGEGLVVTRSMGALTLHRFDFTGAPIGAALPLDVGIAVSGGFRMTPHGTGLAVVARESSSTTTAVLARINATGAVLQTIPFQLTGFEAGVVEVASVGADNMVAWADGPLVQFTTIRADGTVESPRTIIDLTGGSSLKIGMAWTRERLVIVSNRSDGSAIRIALHWHDVAGNELATEEIASFPWSTLGETREPTVLGAPGRAAFAVGFRFEPDDQFQQGIYQRCY